MVIKMAYLEMKTMRDTGSAHLLSVLDDLLDLVRGINRYGIFGAHRQRLRDLEAISNEGLVESCEDYMGPYCRYDG